MLPDSQSMLSTDRPCLPIWALTSTLAPAQALRVCVPAFPFLPLVPHHPPLSNPLIIFTSAAPTPAEQQLLCGCHTPKGALYTFPHVSHDLLAADCQMQLGLQDPASLLSGERSSEVSPPTPPGQLLRICFVLGRER